jgi:DNA-binding HxlR family transcriptional regulator
MLGRDYAGQACSIARALEVIGERWSMLIIRDVFLGLRRFDEIQADLGVARNVLTARLEHLVEAGVLEKVLYQERPARYEYRPTEKGLDLWPVMVELMQWGDRHAPAAAGPPVVHRHRDCGGALGIGRRCERCGEHVERLGVTVEAGPGAGPDHPIHGYLARVGRPAATAEH